MSMLPGRARKITDNAAVLAADDARLTAIVAADLDTLERLLRPEFVFVHADGRVENKSGFLEYVRSGHIRYRAIARNEAAVTLAGDVAILCAAVQFDVTIHGEERTSPARYMSVWTKGAGGWQLLAIDNARPGA
jgi:ketosteroid isomerase-like protein